MVTFLTICIGAIGSLIAQLIIVILIRFRWPIILGKLSASVVFGHGIEFCYPSQREAERDMIENIKTSHTVYIFAMRAFSLTRPDEAFENSLLRDRAKSIRLLLADPGDNFGDNKEIEKRAKELPKSMTTDAYRNDINASVQSALFAKTQNPNIQVKLHKMPSCHRIYICADRAYISFFTRGLLGTQLPVISAKRSSPLYQGMQRYFESIWQNYSREASGLKFHPHA